MVLDEQSNHVRCLRCHGYIIQVMSGWKGHKQIWGNNHGNVCEVHLVGITAVGYTFQKLQ